MQRLPAKWIRYHGAMYRRAENTQTSDTATMVEDIESNAAAKWKEYLQPIIRLIKQQLSLPTCSLLGPHTDLAYGSANNGFNIRGDVGFVGDRPPAIIVKYGKGPLPFSAYVSPSGKLASSVDLGNAADPGFKRVL